MLIDSHAHIYDEQYGDGGAGIIASMADDCLESIVCVGCDAQSSRTCVELAQNNEHIYAAVGVHPYYPETVNDALIYELAELAKCEKVVAIGEFGLDYHRDEFDRAAQIAAMNTQYELAISLKLPMIFHVREATGDFTEFLRYREFPQSGVMHCFSGSWETAEICLNKGLYLSFGGKLTYKNSKKMAEIVNRMPLDRLLLETDAPYLTPSIHAGELNYPKYVACVRDKVAELRGMSPEDVERIANENTKRLFFKLK